MNTKSQKSISNLNFILRLLQDCGFNPQSCGYQDRYFKVIRSESIPQSGMQEIILKNGIGQEIFLTYSLDRQLTLNLFISWHKMPLIKVLEVKDFEKLICIDKDQLLTAINSGHQKLENIITSFENVRSQELLNKCIAYRNTFSTTTKISEIFFVDARTGLFPVILALVDTVNFPGIKKVNLRKINKNVVTQLRYKIKIGQFIFDLSQKLE